MLAPIKVPAPSRPMVSSLVETQSLAIWEKSVTQTLNFRVLLGPVAWRARDSVLFRPDHPA